MAWYLIPQFYTKLGEVSGKLMNFQSGAFNIKMFGVG